MKKVLFLLLTAILCVGGFAQTIDPLLREEMGRRSDEEKMRVIVIMKSQYDRAQLCRRADYFVTRAERREFVVNELKEFATASQYDLRNSLKEMQRAGLTTEPTILWMANALAFDANKTAIENLAQRNDIEMIGYAIERNWIPDGEEARPASNTREITPNVTQVGADQVWDLGYRGDGVVVAVIDTGVNYNHVDLAEHLWDGGTEFPHHGYDVYNNDNDPMDDMGHGSHCAGTVCGDGHGASQTGMAPEATLMCVKCLNSQGGGGADPIAAGIQWAVEHGCDMFSMSLGIANSSTTERTLLRNMCVAALDAGVVAAIAAGNEGDSQWQYPIPNNVRVPGSCPPPYMDDVQNANPGELSCSVCIGAVDYNDNAAYFTSHGPVTWSNTSFGDYPYNPGIGLIRPDVCAPGVDIKSINYASNTGYTTMSGTSMATPCVAGCMALMLSKDINLSPADVCRILEETAVPLAEGKSNIYGFGRVNVFDAVEAIQLGAIKYTDYAVNDPQGNNNHKLNPCESVTLDLTLENITEEPVSGVSVVLSTTDEHVTITDNTVDFPAFAANQTLTVTDAFAFSVDDQVEANYKVKFSIDITVNGEFSATFSFKVPVYDYLLQYGATAVLNDDNANGLLNPGETGDLRIFIDNIGNELAQSLVGTLSTDYEFVTLNVAESEYGTVGAEMMGYADFNVTLDAAAPEDFVIPFTLDLVDANGRHTELTFNYKNACNVIFTLSDSYGDGWNSAYLTVTYSDGTPTENMTINSGNSATYTRELASGSTFSITWHSGSWDNECSFQIAYEDGTVIHQQSGSFSGTLTFDVNCSGGSGIPEFCDPIRNLAYEVDGHNVILTWEAPESGNPTGYEVYRETELLETVTALTFTDMEVEEGEYNYCVYAVYDNCQSEYVCTLVDVTSCGPVQNLQYTLDDDLLLTLTWETPEDMTNFVEYQILKDGEQVGTTNELTYAFTIATGTYDVAVKAVFAECEKAAHVQVCVVGAVENLTYNMVGSSAIISWDEIEGVEQYEITVNGQVDTSISDITYTLVVEDGLTTVKVEPVSECYTIANEIEICYSKPVENLSFVELDAEGMLHFRWDGSQNDSYYEITCNGAEAQMVSTTDAAFAAEVGTNTISVVAHSNYGCDSEPVSLSQMVCAPVDGFDYAFVGNEVTVTWNGDANSYLVKLDGNEVTTVEANSYLAALEGGHRIEVTPDYGDECAALTATFDFNVTNVAPEIRFDDVHAGHMITVWTSVDGAIAYNLYRDGELIADNLTATTYDDTEMAIDMQHCYAVQSVFEKGVSDLSEAACANYFNGIGENGGQVSIFPNPTTDKVTVECVGMSQIDIYNVEGKLIGSFQVDNDSCQIDGLESGIYMLRIHKGDALFVHRVVKM
ncbi:MAG: S8 family serine peptidase [Bacteroidales bacterium]|nr:S8 family serine peptidase [Bacteroidales bacterium]